MSDQYSNECEKIREYFNVIEQRILDPIQKSEISHYCTATLLLLFAAIDGLGKLIHNKDKAGSNERIRAFLDYMGGDYSIRKKELLDLRNSLVHNAINVASFMSQTEKGSEYHLRTINSVGIIYVNTTTLLRDFNRAFERIRKEFEVDKAMLSRAANRLEWREDDYDDDTLNILATPPPPVQFVWAR